MKIAPAAVDVFLAGATMDDRDPQGRPRYVGEVAGLRVGIVIALEQADLVVSVQKRRS